MTTCLVVGMFTAVYCTKKIIVTTQISDTVNLIVGKTLEIIAALAAHMHGQSQYLGRDQTIPVKVPDMD